MKNETDLQKLLEFIKHVDYALTPTEKMIVQKERNELKYNLLEGFIDALVEMGLPRELMHRTTDGYIFELQNEEHGMIPIQFDIKVKDMDYDLDAAKEDWDIKVQEKREKELAKEREEQRKAEKRAAKGKYKGL